MDSEYFIHPHDAKALNALKAIPGFPILTKKYMDIFVAPLLRRLL